MQYQNIYDQWQQGELDDRAALQAMTDNLNRVQDSLQPLQETEKVLRAQISEVVERMGGRADISGFGSFHITSPSITATYDRRKLDQLVDRLKAAGQGELADEIAACRQESMRSGGLRIARLRDPE